jgi:ectoine hydroxylase-related dioxygenase (phytanoyl-CoA dioxygenase family)
MGQSGMLTELQKSEFWDKGVLVVESAFSPEQLKPLQDEFDRWVDESRNHPADFGEMLDGRSRFDVQPGHSSATPALRRIASPEEISSLYLKILHEGPLVEAVADLIGENLRFHHAKLNSKLPGSATTVKWHQDFTFDPHSNDDCITAMLFLDDVSHDNGPARIVPGSHRGPLYSLWQEGVFTGAVEESVALECEQKAVECTGPAGSLCLMHTRCLHGSAENMTDQARTLFITNLTAADAVQLSPSAVPSIHSGKIVHGQDPQRIRSVSFEMENPEIPEGASFFNQQEK